MVEHLSCKQATGVRFVVGARDGSDTLLRDRDARLLYLVREARILTTFRLRSSVEEHLASNQTVTRSNRVGGSGLTGSETACKLSTTTQNVGDLREP